MAAFQHRSRASSSADLVESSVKVAFSGSGPFVGPYVGCTPDGGSTDGGFCRIAHLPVRLGTLESLRGSLFVRASAADDLANGTNIDAGSLAVSRWAFSFDGGSGVNGFSLGSRTLVIPNTVASALLTVGLSGGPPTSAVTSYPPIRNVAVGSRPPETAYVLGFSSGNLASVGETFDTASLTGRSFWAFEAIRTGVQSTSPILASNGTSESVATAFKSGAAWAVYDTRARLVDSGMSANAPSSTNGPFSAVGRGFKLAATDGTSLFTFSGSSVSSFAGLEATQILALPVPFTSVTHLIGVTGGVAGSGAGMGLSRSFSATPATFTPWAGGRDLRSASRGKRGSVLLSTAWLLLSGV